MARAELVQRKNSNAKIRSRMGDDDSDLPSKCSTPKPLPNSVPSSASKWLALTLMTSVSIWDRKRKGKEAMG